MANEEIRRTDWHAFGHYGLTDYRIWNKKTPHGMWQRHEWKREDGSSYCEEWIATPFHWAHGAVAA